MADNWALNGVSRDDGRTPPGPDAPPGGADAPRAAAPGSDAPRRGDGRTPRPRPGLGDLLTMAVGIVGLAALGASAWVYAETQRDIRRVAGDIAQIRVSLELFARQQSTGGSTAATDSDARLLDLANRLALLEANERSGGAPAGAAEPAAAVSGAASAGGTVATGGDCLPVGMRFMVAAGDSYAVCGTTAKVAIASVDAGYVTLADGTIVAEGGTINLAGSQCMMGVVPSEGDGLSGYAEIRVAC